MRYNLRELDKTSGLYARLKSTKFTILSSFRENGRVESYLGRVTYFFFLTVAFRADTSGIV